MEKIKLVMLLVTVMTFLGIGNVNAQEKNPQTVIVQIFPESKGVEIHLSLLVTTPDATSYEIPMESLTTKNKRESMINNSKILQKEIDKWKKEGFVVDEVSGSLIESFMLIMSKD